MSHQGRILVVDDEPRWLEPLSHVLTSAGYGVRAVNGGEPALASVADGLPDLILLDIRMPGMGGFEVLKRFKARAETRDIPILLLSAFAEVDERIEGLKLGAVDSVTKPFHAGELLARVRMQLELSRLRARHEGQTATLKIINEQLESEIAFHKQTEAELRRSEDRLRFALQTMSAGAWELDLVDHTAHRTSLHDRIFGYETKLPAWTYEMFLEHVLPEDRAEVDRCFRWATETHSDWGFECRIRRTDGVVRWIWAAGAHERNAEGKPVRMAGIVQDITERHMAEAAMRENEANLAITLHSIGDAVIAADAEGRITRMNPVAERLTGWPLAEAAGRPMGEVFRIINAHTRNPVENPVEQVIARGVTVGLANHTVLLARDGREFQIADSAAPIRNLSGEIVGVVLVFSDVTERYKADARIARLTQLYAALSQCNKAIVHSSSLEELLPQVCSRVVEFGGMKMAWIGMVDEATGMVRPVATYGSGTDYLQGIRISTDERDATGRGPTGSAIRENRPVWCQDYQNDPTTAPWHEHGTRYGWMASAALPLRRGGKTIGALGIFSDKAHVFDEEVRELLEEMADDVSFALDNFAREEERRKIGSIMKARLRLVDLSGTHSLEDLLVAALDEAEALTGSQVGFYHFLAEDQQTLLLQAWSTRTSRDMCQAEGKGRHYDVSEAGVWVDCIRENRPVIHNDYAALPHRKGLPPGHASIIRELVVPVLRNEKIVAILGVGNKSADYTGDDVKTVSQLADIAWDICELKRKEEDLRKSEEDLSRAQAIAHLGNWSWDIPSDRISCSEELFRIYGADPYTFGGDIASVAQFMHPEDLWKLERVVSDARAGRPSQPIDWRIVRLDGSERVVEVSSMELEVGADGRPGKTFGITLDITERRRAEELTRMMSEMLDAAPCSITVHDFEGRFLYANRRTSVWHDYGHEELMALSLGDLDVPESKALFKERVRLIEELGEAVFEVAHCRKDGSTLPLQVFAKKVAWGGKPAILGVSTDITERKIAEEELKALNSYLEEQKVRADELAVEAQGAARAKSEFLALMSHELRTPLNGVLGFAELLSGTRLDEEQEEFTKTILDSGKHLLDLVNDILDFSSIDKGHMQIESAPILVAALVESSCSPIRKAAADKGLEFSSVTAADVPEEITGDIRRIRQILINLLGNAIKFTRRGAVVLEIATSSLDGCPALEFSVEDTGPGIAPEMIGYLFKPFTQADSTVSRQFEGTGLGLAISLRLAEAMGGTLGVVSNPGKGSRFTFRFPLRDGAPASPNNGSGDTSSSPDNKGGATWSPPADNPVLVVEDDLSSRILAGKMLEHLGCRAEFATNGQEAVDAFAPEKFSAILMDMQMPVMDGLEATRGIRELESGTRLPIIALTANVMPGDRERCLAAGMDAVLTKPFKMAELSAMLARFLQS